MKNRWATPRPSRVLYLRSYGEVTTSNGWSDGHCRGIATCPTHAVMLLAIVMVMIVHCSSGIQPIHLLLLLPGAQTPQQQRRRVVLVAGRGAVASTGTGWRRMGRLHIAALILMLMMIMVVNGSTGGAVQLADEVPRRCVHRRLGLNGKKSKR